VRSAASLVLVYLLFSPSAQAQSHWWRNETKSPVELYSADLFPTSMMGAHEKHTM
jgi:hypothetical protein